MVETNERWIFIYFSVTIDLFEFGRPDPIGLDKARTGRCLRTVLRPVRINTGRAYVTDNFDWMSVGRGHPVQTETDRVMTILGGAFDAFATESRIGLTRYPNDRRKNAGTTMRSGHADNYE